MKNLFEGNNVKLGAIRESDIAEIEKWFDNISFLRYYDMVPAIPKTRKQVEELIREHEASTEKYIFAVRLAENEKIIGIAGYYDIIWSNKVATAFIGIGDKGSTGKGFGKEAMRLLLEFGFNELNFYRIQLNVISYNEVAIKLYESLGFIKEGTYRNFILRDGKRYDMYLYGLLKPEWDASA